MPFGQFNEASIKNKVRKIKCGFTEDRNQNLNWFPVHSQVLTVYEMFGRHLFQLPGFSAEKAAAVLERYPTPVSSCIATHFI